MGKIKFLFVILIIFLVCKIAWKPYNIANIESFTGLSLKEKIKYDSKYEVWAHFIGEGIVVWFFDIKDEYMPSILEEMKINDWMKCDSLTKRLQYDISIEKYQKKIDTKTLNLKGYYKRFEDLSGIEGAIIDIHNKKLIYYVWV